MQKDKILFVIERYGDRVHGGAEWLCRQVAERLVEHFDVEVATTKAIDYSTWKDHFRENEENLNGVHIRRFGVDRLRAKDHAHTEAMLRSNINDLRWNSKWILDQGPLSSSLVKFVEENHNKYKKIIVFHYLYTVSFQVTKVVPAERLVFVPLAHDEPQLRYPVFREVFQKPKWIVCNTQIEYDLAKEAHLVAGKNAIIAGAGVDVPVRFDTKAFKKKFGLDKYLIFVGRLDPAKRVDILAKDFAFYKKEYPSDLKLVLIGREVAEIKSYPDIIKPGFVSEEDKFAAIAGAFAMVNPSPYESLSIILLESFMMKRPVIVNAYCDVLKDHCVRSNGGLWYETHIEFNECVNYLLTHLDITDKMGELGYNYTKENYDWGVVMRKWVQVINS